MIMNGLTKTILTVSGTTLNGSGKVTNFSPNGLLVVVKAGSEITHADLKKIKITANFKNSVGSSIAVCNNLPVDIIANLSDFQNGFGLLGGDTAGSFYLPLGKYILKADDDLTFTVVSETLSQSVELYLFAVDNAIGKERLLSYKYIKASATQVYQDSNVCMVFGQFTNPSDNVYITVSDFFGSNNISELACAGLGAALGSAEDFDNFGQVFLDTTGLSQNVSVRAGGDGEEFLVQTWNFDTNRLGYDESDVRQVGALASDIMASNPSKAKCLKAYYG